jgi:polyisoprenyl-phosphate glycosyltransferase
MIESNKSAVSLSIVIPIYNEEKNIQELYNRLRAVAENITQNYELIFVNDASKDASFETILHLSSADSRIKYINFSRNFGHQIAVCAGLDYSSGDAVVIIDGDLQDPPELIEQLYQKHLEGFDVVYAQRRKREGETWIKKITAKAFYRLLKAITTIDIPLDTGDYRLISREVVTYLKLMNEQNKFLRGQISWLGFRQIGVLFDRNERQHGKTGYTFSKMLRFAMDGITSFSDFPLRMVTRLGLLVSFFSLVVILYALYSHFFLNQTITGWTSLIMSSMFIGGVQLLSIGIIGEYISRINRNVQNRPLYVIQNSNIDKDQVNK